MTVMMHIMFWGVSAPVFIHMDSKWTVDFPE